MKIRKGVPIPATAETSVYPWGEMEVGDCFDVPGNQRNKVRSAANMRRIRVKKAEKYIVRVVDVKGQPVTRCWRSE